MSRATFARHFCRSLVVGRRLPEGEVGVAYAVVFPGKLGDFLTGGLFEGAGENFVASTIEFGGEVGLMEPAAGGLPADVNFLSGLGNGFPSEQSTQEGVFGQMHL